MAYAPPGAMGISKYRITQVTNAVMLSHCFCYTRGVAGGTDTHEEVDTHVSHVNPPPPPPKKKVKYKPRPNTKQKKP